ncbi:MAG: hypothetical protein ACE5GF_00675 [Thermodesulfobacteriota bacterium]
MKKRIIILSVLLIVIAAFTFGCSKSEEKEGTAKEETPAYKSEAPAPPPAQAVRQGGIVKEHFDAEGYTYLSLEDSEGIRMWVAAPQMEVKVDDVVEISGANLMTDFHSKTLDRTFDAILFANSARVVDKGEMMAAVGQLPPDHPPLPEVTTSVKNIEKVKGGYTVAELYSKRKELKGSDVKIRGKVVKYTEGIMGRNWIHLRDGTGDEGSNDITITTTQRSAVGDVIVASGKLETDRNLGGGYHYPVIIEDASLAAQ